MSGIVIYLLGCYLMNSHQFLAKFLATGQLDSKFSLARQVINLVWPIVVVGMILTFFYYRLR
jgi:hypothetical protein